VPGPFTLGIPMDFLFSFSIILRSQQRKGHKNLLAICPHRV